MIRPFIEGTPVADLDEDTLRAEVAKLVRAYEVSNRRWVRGVNALVKVRRALATEAHGFIAAPSEDQLQRWWGYGAASMADRVGGALGRVEDWMLRNTKPGGE